MAVEPWDEKKLSELYQLYQQRRDGIEFCRYQPLREAARRLLVQQAEQVEAEQVQLEPGIESVLNSARKMYLENARLETSTTDSLERATSAPGDSISSLGHWLQSIKESLIEFMEQLSPAQWVPVAATALLLLLVSPMMIDTFNKQAGVPDYIAQQVELLQQKDTLVGTEISSLNEWQYGFSSSRDEFGRAFTSGVLLVDLMVLSETNAGTTRMGIEKALRDNLQASSPTVTEMLNQGGSTGDTEALADELNQVYSETGLGSVYRLGQWVESSYLQARMSEISEQADDLSSILASREQLIASLEQDGHYRGHLVEDMKYLEAAERDMQEPMVLSKISQRLLKLRTLLMMQKP